MSWKAKVKELGPASVLFLSADGASVNFIVVGDPIPMQSKYRGKENTRVACPVVTDEGFVLFITGVRTCRKLSTLEDKFTDHVINVTRHGAEGDPEATYECTALQDATLFKALAAVKAKTFTKAALADAMKDAEEVLSR